MADESSQAGTPQEDLNSVEFSEGFEIRELPTHEEPFDISKTTLEIQQENLDEGEESRKISVTDLVEKIKPNIQDVVDVSIVEHSGGTEDVFNAFLDDNKARIEGWIDSRITAEDIQGKIDASFAAVTGEARTTILRDGETFTLPTSATIGDNIELLVHQPVTRGYIQQVKDTTLMHEDFYNPSGADGDVKTRNHQLLRLTYVADDLVDDKAYADLGDITDTPPTGEVTAIAVSANGNYVAVGHKNAPFLSVYRVDGRVLRKIGDGNVAVELTGQPTALAFDSTRNWIHVGTSVDFFHLVYQIEDRADGDAELSRQAYNQRRTGEPDYSVDVSPDGVYIAEGHAGGTVTITLSSSRKRVAHPYTSSGVTDVVHSLAWSPKPPEGTDQLLAIGHFGSPCITFMALRDGAFVQLDPVRTIRHRSQAIKDLAWSSDGELLAAVVGSEVIVYNMIGEGREVVKEITHKYNNGEFSTVAFSSRKHLAVSSGLIDGTQVGQVDFYDFSNNEAPGDNERLLTLSGLFGITAALWTVGDGYFLIGTNTPSYLKARHAAEYLKGVWVINVLSFVKSSDDTLHSSGDVQNKDFSSFVPA